MSIKPTFESVTPTDDQIKILYDILSSRVHSISHARIPSFADHQKFVSAHPYRAWYLIFISYECVGSVYVNTDNTIGLNVKEGKVSDCLIPALNFIKQNHRPLSPIDSIRNKNFTTNVPPSNIELIKELEKANSKVLQITYSI